MKCRNCLISVTSEGFYFLLTLIALIALTSLVSASAQTLGDVATKPTFKVLYAFSGGVDGAYPNGQGSDTALTFDREGNIYGTTSAGGNNNVVCFSYYSPGCGVVFKVNRSGQEMVLHTFGAPPDGAGPIGGLFFDAQKNLYGATQFGGGGALPNGTIFKLDPFDHETIIHSFSSTPDGAVPFANAIRDYLGNLYGTTGYGGAYNNGIVYKIDREGNEAILYTFTGGLDGGSPNNLIRLADGSFIGSAALGGTSNSGVLFHLDRYGNETVLHNFNGQSDGTYPQALTEDDCGNFYGVTPSTVFKFDRNQNFTVLYTFTGGNDGGLTFSRLLVSGGNLYGDTLFGGTYTDGVVFKVNIASGKETVLYNFTGGTDGGFPVAGLLQDEEGNLYGTAQGGGDLNSPVCGSFGCGVVFEIEHGANSRDDEYTADAPPHTLPAVTARTSRPLVAGPHPPRVLP